MPKEPDYLDRRHAQLLREYEQTWVPKVEAAKRRREAMGRVFREVAVQALATVIGGAVLGGGAVALGWLGGSAQWRALGAAIAFTVVLFLVVSLWTASKPLDTRDDHALLGELRMIEALIADREEAAAADNPSDDGA